jgi:hypothetical protein
MKIYKTYEGHRTQFVVLKPKERVEKQGLNQTRTSYTLNTVSGYDPYLKSQRSKNYKIGVVGKKIRFSTISPEKKRSLNSHFSYLKSGPQYPDRKEIKTEKETFFIQRVVPKVEYKRHEEGLATVT